MIQELLIDNQLYNNLLIQFQSFECYHMLFDFFYLFIFFIFFCWSKKFRSSVKPFLSFVCILGRKYPVHAFLPSLFSNDKTKTLFAPWKFGSTWLSKYGFCFCFVTFEWYLIQLITLSLPGLNCCNSCALS